MSPRCLYLPPPPQHQTPKFLHNDGCCSGKPGFQSGPVWSRCRKISLSMNICNEAEIDSFREQVHHLYAMASTVEWCVVLVLE